MKNSAPLSWIELSASALHHNIRTLSRMAAPKRMLAAPVKADAYGHGLEQIVTLLSSEKQVDYLAVHSLGEAERARQSGWSRKIMLVGPIFAGRSIKSDFALLDAALALDTEPLVTSVESLAVMAAYAKKRATSFHTHLKLETGTHRQGVIERDLPKIARLYKSSPLKQPYACTTHFANIEDTTDHSYAHAQLERFQQMVSMLRKLGTPPTIQHTAASAATILFNKTRFDLVRPGISLYGHWPSKETFLSHRLHGGREDAFKPVLSWRTRITQLQDIPADSFIGYGCTYRTTSRTKLAILPIGYFDGYPRALSNQAYVLIRGKRAPVRGRVCMDLVMVDVTDIRGVRMGDIATLIGSDGDETISVEQLAALAGTINYELLARLSAETERFIVP